MEILYRLKRFFKTLRRLTREYGIKVGCLTRHNFAGLPAKMETLQSDEALWHHSWSLNPENPVHLDSLLSRAESYGFSFVGFSREVRGRLSMDEFTIR